MVKVAISMEADFEQIIASMSIPAKEQEALRSLSPGAYCQHKSWGFGRVAHWNADLGQIVVDFVGKKGHAMEIAYAGTSLKPLTADHILVKCATEPEEVRRMATHDVAELMRISLASHGGSALQEVLKQSLSGALDELALKKFFESAKRQLKKNGHFGVPTRKADPWILRETSIGRGDELLQDFQRLKKFRDKAAVVDQILKETEVFKEESTPLQQMVDQLNDHARKQRNLTPPEAVESVLCRDELLEAFPALQPPHGLLLLPDLLRQEQTRLAPLLTALPAVRLRRVVACFQQAFEADWSNRLLDLLPGASGRLASELVRCLLEAGKGKEAETSLTQLMAEGKISSDLLLWFLKERKTTFPSLANHRLFLAIIGSLERDLMNEVRKTRLQDFMMEDKELVSDLLADAEKEVVRDVTRRLMASPAVDEINKRSIMARILKLHPDMHSVMTASNDPMSSENREAKADPTQEPLVVSWPSLEKRKLEYDDLVNKRIPDNSKQINIARSYGDLRENFEFKSAKEMQAVLMRRKAELEVDLARAQGTDFANPDISQVSIGTTVTLRDLSTGGSETYTLLGAWDSEPESGILSYMTSIGQALLSKKAGDEAILPMETGERRVRIEAINPWKAS